MGSKMGYGQGAIGNLFTIRVLLVAHGLRGLFQAPFVTAIGMAATMSGKKSAAILPEQRPDHLSIRGGQRLSWQFLW
jgi:hypothetical protein